MTTSRQSRPWSGRMVLYALLAFFAIIIATNAAFIIVALRTFPGEDVQRSYLQGLRYNEQLAARRAQDELRWDATAGFVSDESGVSIDVRIRDETRRPLSGLRLAGALRRPADARFDQVLRFEEGESGLYRARINEPGEGIWDLRVRAESAGDVFELARRLTWRSR